MGSYTRSEKTKSGARVLSLRGIAIADLGLLDVEQLRQRLSGEIQLAAVKYSCGHHATRQQSLLAD